MTPDAPSIPEYHLLRIIGRGGYGDVWLARGITGLYRAVKIVRRDRFSDAEPYEREFKGLREFAAISLLEPHQLALLHVGRNDAAGFFYYVMELADDVAQGAEIEPENYIPHTLKESRERRGRLPTSQVIALAAQLARALVGLHARGLVHRDVKPSNVVFVGGTAKLADIGLVTVATAADTFVGTEGFVPPEGPGTAGADVFSLGKLLYEIATGLDRHEYPRLPPNLGNLSDRKELLELNEILICACDPHADKRYPDAAAFLKDVMLLQSGRSMRRLRAAERTMTRSLRIGAVFAFGAAVAGAGAYVERRRAGHEDMVRRQMESERIATAHKSAYASGLAKTQRALEMGDLGHARRQLHDLIPASGMADLRGFEWHALFAEAQGHPATVLQDSGPLVDRVCFSRDGRLIALHTGVAVTLWETASRRLILTIPGIHRLVDFSPDGKWLVGTDPEFGLQRWAVATGTMDASHPAGLNRPLATSGSEEVVCFTEKSAAEPSLLRTWNFAQRAETRRLPLPLDHESWDFFCATVSADGRRCALALIGGRAHQAEWKLLVGALDTGEILREEITPHRISALAFSADGTYLACAFGDTMDVRVRDFTQGTWVGRQTFGGRQSEALSFSPDGSRLAIAGRDSVVRLVDVKSGDLNNVFEGLDGSVTDLAWSADGTSLAAASNSGQVRIWQQPTKLRRRERTGFSTSVESNWRVCFSDDARQLAITGNGQTVVILDSFSLEQVGELKNAGQPLAFTDQSHALMALTPAGTIQRQGLASPSIVEEIPPDRFAKEIKTVALSPDERWLILGSAGGRVQIWDRPARKLIAEQIVPDCDFIRWAAFAGNRMITHYELFLRELHKCLAR